MFLSPICNNLPYPINKSLPEQEGGTERRKGEKEYIEKINLPSLNAEFGATVMSEILQSVHSLAVTNEVIKWRRGEGSWTCFSH